MDLPTGQHSKQPTTLSTMALICKAKARTLWISLCHSPSWMQAATGLKHSTTHPFDTPFTLLVLYFTWHLDLLLSGKTCLREEFDEKKNDFGMVFRFGQLDWKQALSLLGVIFSS